MRFQFGSTISTWSVNDFGIIGLIIVLVIALFGNANFDDYILIALTAVAFFLVFHLTNQLGELHRHVDGLHKEIVSERLQIKSQDYVSEKEKQADDLAKDLTQVRISALGSTVAWIVILGLVMGVTSHLSNQKRSVASYHEWRRDVIDGAAERSRGGGCGTVVERYFEDLDDASSE
jgi:hypothetical protein